MIVFTFDTVLVIQLILTILMPIVVGLITTRTTKGSTKAWLLASFTVIASILTGLGNALATDTVFDIGTALFLSVPAFAISVATYYGLWKPTGVGAAAQDVSVTTLVR